MDFEALENEIFARFYRCNEMTKKQAEDYAWIAVNQMKRNMGLISYSAPDLTNPQTYSDMGAPL